MRKPRPAARAGFTLLEVLVSLALTVLLAAAVYTGLNMYWRYSTAGRDEAERAQLARSLLRMIELDIRSIVYYGGSTDSDSQEAGAAGGVSAAGGNATGGGAAGGASGSGAGGGAGSAGGTGSGAGSSGSAGSGGSGGGSQSGGSTGTSQMATPDSAAGTTTSGLYGDATTLMMHVSRPAKNLTYFAVADQQTVTSRTSDLQTVAYFVSGSGAGSLQSAVNESGLARLAGDRLMLSLLDEQGNLAALMDHVSILASEVVGLRFSYFDGTAWRSDWDSSVLAGLPRAIEILLELKSTDATGGETGEIYRHVVSPPMSKPIDTSSVQ